MLPQLSAVHWSEKHFKNAMQFCPQRFIDDPKLAEKVTPFSMGKRQCLGESLARAELFMIFTTLLQQYTLTLAADMNADECMKPVMRFARHPSPHELVFSKRYTIY